jgi:hypothetical protein
VTLPELQILYFFIGSTVASMKGSPVIWKDVEKKGLLPPENNYASWNRLCSPSAE